MNTSTTAGDQRGRVGTLENPEVHPHIPGRVIPILEREFDDFDAEAQKFLDGETGRQTFMGFRLRQGVYGQRQPDVQMIGSSSPLVDSRRISSTPLPRSPKPMHRSKKATSRPGKMSSSISFHCWKPHGYCGRLGDAGLSTREACGNTVRNVVCDPFAGVDPGRSI